MVSNDTLLAKLDAIDDKVEDLVHVTEKRLDRHADEIRDLKESRGRLRGALQIMAVLAGLLGIDRLLRLFNWS